MVTAYANSERWADVTPIHLSEAEEAAVRIAYPDDFKEIFAYFRAILAKKELSERALELTTDAIEHNPANYTLWQYRKELLKHLKKSLSDELEMLDEVIREHPKNYQVWHHRKWLVEEMGDPSKELTFTAEIFRDDSKNYHAWQHRHWVVKRFDLWSTELDFAEHLLKDDLRNNSAWNYRYFVINNTTGFTPDVINREIEFTKQFINTAPRNESSWNYLNGVLIEADEPTRDAVWTFATELRKKEGAKESPYLLGFMIDALDNDLGSKKDLDANTRASKIALLNELIEEVARVDPIRKHYWHFMRKYLGHRHGC